MEKIGLAEQIVGWILFRLIKKNAWERGVHRTGLRWVFGLPNQDLRAADDLFHIEQRTLQFSLPSPRETQQPERVANGTSAMATKIRENVRPTNRVNSGILGNIFRRQETPPDSI